VLISQADYQTARKYWEESGTATNYYEAIS
jgi:hypothetical protein